MSHLKYMQKKVMNKSISDKKPPESWHTGNLAQHNKDHLRQTYIYSMVKK